MKKVVSLITIFILVGCASKRICPSAAEEPVSTCRAEAERKHGGTALGIILAGFNPTANARNPAIDQYNQCIDNSRELKKPTQEVPHAITPASPKMYLQGTMNLDAISSERIRTKRDS